MNNIRPLIKRVLAYMIDLIIIITITSLITYIPIFDKKMNSYEKKYNEYQDKYNEYADYLKLLEESYKDNEIDEEEYTKLTEEKKYQTNIKEYYEDNKISQGEYKKIVNELNEDYSTIANNYTYKLNKLGSFNSIITLICTLLYFGLFQYLLKGQTIGKKILKLKVVSASNKKINILNYILRSLIVNDVLLNGVGVIFLLTTSKKVYLQANNILGILISISEAIIIFLVVSRDDHRGLHDLLFNTQVIDLEPRNNENEESTKITNIDNNKVIEAEYKEEEINGKENKPKGKSKKQRKK